ncbi:hypothetical protein [Caballeronia sp. SBC2]|uniref:hypothetical protein n=1 Tax=Caballeronia sp. SBC2 TaxID=2705547 RepID=UPI0013E19ABD|nr:hypothetical protein [Caballeronia sp. SBC2]QIE22877.1 hypothetical protein SBC2_08900 [Caballeronia sp. SBC2]
MKSFQFESISLLSHRDKKARKVQFHPRRNLILGENHTGKSSLVKNLFIALGATPKGKLEQWDPLTISAVDFKVDGAAFRVVHQNGSRALFDADGNLLSTTSTHAIWADVFADLVGFNLVVTSKKDGKATRADPACFFLPFYIDQDGSWRDKWETFPATLRFLKPVPNVIEYFGGIKPPEYYALKGEHNALSKKADAEVNEMRVLERARGRLIQTLPSGGVNLTEDGFAEEVKRLTTEASKLNTQQEKLRVKYVRESEVVLSMQQQVELASASLRAYAGDQKYLARRDEAHQLICPTCGAEHEQSFLHVLGYAEDARILEELTLTLQKELKSAALEKATTSSDLTSLRENYARINDILESKRGDLKFREIVESQGAQVANRAFEVEREQLGNELALLNAELQKVDIRLAELTNKKRTKQIVDEFRQAYAAARKALNVPEPTGRINLMSRPNRSGSGGPRLLLAYYAAIWKICLRESLNAAIPVVIDSPNQQDQDDVNLHVVLEFIAESLPDSMQLIVCVTKNSEAELDQTIVFEEKYSLLKSEMYDAVESDIGPLFREMNAVLLNTPS